MMRIIFVSILFSFSILSHGECDFEEVIPKKWVEIIPEDQVQSHIDLLNQTTCSVLNMYFSSINEPQRDCEKIPEVVPPVLRLKQDGDSIAYFSSPATCESNSSNPMYTGYVLYRNGKQVAFELRIGTHNKRLWRQ